MPGNGPLTVMHPVRCLLCLERIEARDLVLHVHRMHPEADAEPERWPDGEPVAYEDPELMEAH